MEATEKQTRFAFVTALLIALMSLTGIALFAQGAGQVNISGRLIAPDAPFDDALVVVEMEHTACLWSELGSDGRFDFRVPVGRNVRLVFLRPNHLTKEVLVDTRNAMITDRAERLNRKVKFDVMMMPVEEHLHEAYLGPVGYIGFVNGSGLMTIRYDGRMKPVAAQDVAVQP